jgi:hypothetical protein
MVRARASKFALSLLAGASALLAISAHAQLAVDISVNTAPPPLPVYDQPPVPGPDYIWTPGYWAWDPDVADYYWVPGEWVTAPSPGLLWTPAWWGWDSGVYRFHAGYWGPHVGFYGGINYGFGYTGAGFEGGQWRDGHFAYNQSVTNVHNTSITNVYNKTVVVNNQTRVSYNGGPSGVHAQPTPEQIAAEHETHMPPTAGQTHGWEEAHGNKAMFVKANHGTPPAQAMEHPAGAVEHGNPAEVHGGPPQPAANAPHAVEAPHPPAEVHRAEPPAPQRAPEAQVAPHAAEPAPHPAAPPPHPEAPPPPHPATAPPPHPAAPPPHPEGGHEPPKDEQKQP